jgi:Spy/CpxP family protein refolding chaperone
MGLGLAVWALAASPAFGGVSPGLAPVQNLAHPAIGDMTPGDRALPHADAPDALLAAETSAECPATAGPADAQKDRKHKWWSSEEGRAEFGLTEAQSRDLEAIFQQTLPELRANKAEVDRYQQQLTKLLSEASARESVVVKAIDQLEAAQSALSRTRTIMLYRMYRLLNPEQRAKVQAYYDRKAKEPDGQSVRR